MPGDLNDTLKNWGEVFERRSMRNFILYTKERGLSMSQVGALFHIHRKGASGVSDIGSELGITSAAVSQMLDRLVQQDLVLRTEDPHDRRLKQIVLTRRGLDILNEGIQARQRWLIDLASSLSPTEQEQVMVALQIMIEKISLSEETSCEPVAAHNKEVRSQ